MGTLVIHPKDPSTDFLKPIYQDIKDCIVLTCGSKEQVIKEIEYADRVIMMGHGSPNGLFSVGQFYNDYNGYVIESSIVPYLQNKDNIYIWCHASTFVKNYNLKGFASGMFISEIQEAYFCGISNVKPINLYESNNYFSKLVGAYSNKDSKIIFNQVKEFYNIMAQYNPIAKYNSDRLLLSI